MSDETTERPVWIEATRQLELEGGVLISPGSRLSLSPALAAHFVERRLARRIYDPEPNRISAHPENRMIPPATFARRARSHDDGR